MLVAREEAGVQRLTCKSRNRYVLLALKSACSLCQMSQKFRAFFLQRSRNLLMNANAAHCREQRRVDILCIFISTASESCGRGKFYGVRERCSSPRLLPHLNGWSAILKAEANSANLANMDMTCS
jgi:hypothetical protein